MTRIAVLTPMPSELRPVVAALSLQRTELDGRSIWSGTVGDIEIVAAKTGMGTITSAEVAEWMLDHGPVDHVLVVGIAGGVGPIKIGEVVVPETVVNTDTGEETHPSPFGGAERAGIIWTSNVFDADPRRTFAPGVVAVDMETAAIGTVCERRGCPWSAFRSISDRLDDKIVNNDVFGMANPDGSPNVGAALRYIARRPWHLPRLLRVGADSTRAAKAAANAAAAALAVAAG
jgi:adenosylhomocysteine nucleosidase